MSGNPDRLPGGSMPWETEGDIFSWREPTTGLKCLMLRNLSMKHWCGYVQVTSRHPLSRVKDFRPARRVLNPKSSFGYDYVQVFRAGKGPSNVHRLNVHGGVTFTGRTRHLKMSRHWWIGFDCGHSGDLQPGLRERLGNDDFYSMFPRHDTYRTKEYVQNQCNALAIQLGRMQCK